MGEVFWDILFFGVLNIIFGGDNFGFWMMVYFGFDKIFFIGFIVIGKSVMESVVKDLKVFMFEFGGNDVVIVLLDVDFDDVV